MGFGNLTRTHRPRTAAPRTEAYGDVQVVFLMLVYAYILSFASNMISDGSELLLLVPSMRGPACSSQQLRSNSTDALPRPAFPVENTLCRHRWQCCTSYPRCCP